MERLFNLQDQYKFPMGQLIYDQAPDATVTFAMTNRKARTGMRIADYVEPAELQHRYDDLRELQFTRQDIDVLESQTDKAYSKRYLGYLAAVRLPEITVSIDPASNDITATTTSQWNRSSLWEIPMLNAIPELYYPSYIKAHGHSLDEVWAEGDRRLTHMIELFGQYPDLKFAEFGTRRRFSAEWQDHAVGRFVAECPDNLIGTSNPYLANKYGIPAVGTHAHELGMTYAALAEARGENPLDGSYAVTTDWLERFPGMPVALIDTFTSDVALHDLSPEHIDQLRSFRIDSGNEYEIGAKVIAFLRQHGVDPRSRMLFFSNSLTPEKAVELHLAFRDHIGVAFGIGGHAVNNMGFDSEHDLPRMNIVAKAVNVNGHGTVKLSDDEGKHTGDPSDVARYQRYVTERLA